MTVYLIGGLGADVRVFDALMLTVPTVFIDWIEPKDDESLKDYAQRLSTQIDKSQPFALLGVSYGGVIALEISQLLCPVLTIIISSVTHPNELPLLPRLANKLRLLRFIPKVTPPMFGVNYLFSAQNKRLLKLIVRDTDPSFVKWALQSLFAWEGCKLPSNFFRYHGTRDKLIPLRGEATKVYGGGHFMVVDKGLQISKVINNLLAEQLK